MKTEKGMQRYLDRWVRGVKSHKRYLDAVGAERLAKLAARRRP